MAARALLLTSDVSRAAATDPLVVLPSVHKQVSLAV